MPAAQVYDMFCHPKSSRFSFTPSRGCRALGDSGSLLRGKPSCAGLAALQASAPAERYRSWILPGVLGARIGLVLDPAGGDVHDELRQLVRIARALLS